MGHPGSRSAGHPGFGGTGRPRKGQARFSLPIPPEAAAPSDKPLSAAFPSPPPGRSPLCEWEIDTPLGRMVALADSAGLRLLQFADSPKLRSQKEHCLRRLGPPIATRSNEHLEKIERELAEYFARERSRFSVPIAPFGTPWQLAVWSRLLQHRADSTLFYEELARELGSPKAVRAVGSAVGANPLLIVCPCHRVIPKKGGVGGYAAAPWRKERLLSLEASTRENGPAAEERPPTHGTMTSNSAGEIEKEQGV